MWCDCAGVTPRTSTTPTTAFLGTSARPTPLRPPHLYVCVHGVHATNKNNSFTVYMRGYDQPDAR